MKQRARRIWTDVERYTLELAYPDEPTWAIARVLGRTIGQVYQQAARLGLSKSPSYLASPHAQRMRRGYNPGTPFRFEKGHVPANKGLRRPGWHSGRMCETQFKKGTLNGRAREIVQPVGAERISKDGYLERKVNNDLPFQRRWRAVHLVVWEAANGPLPPGHAIAFKDRDKKNIALENFELITRADLMRRNTIHNYPPELKGAIRALTSLKRRLKKDAHGEEQDRGSPQSPV